MAATEASKPDPGDIIRLEGEIEAIVLAIAHLDNERAGLVQERDDLIRARGLQDTSLRRLGRLAGMSYQMIWFILREQPQP